jgi:hypothetical protein
VRRGYKELYGFRSRIFIMDQDQSMMVLLQHIFSMESIEVVREKERQKPVGGFNLSVSLCLGGSG